MRVALFVVVTGCTGIARPPTPPPEPDAANPPVVVALFAPITCTSGAAGDTTGCASGGACCPLNTLDLSAAPINLAGAELEFAVHPFSPTELDLTFGELRPGSQGLHVENLRFGVEPCAAPGFGLTGSFLPGEIFTLPDEPLVGFESGMLLCVVADVIGPTQP